MAKRKKISGAILIATIAVSLLVGLVGGAAGGVFAANETYVIPDKVTATVYQGGALDENAVNAIKSDDTTLSVHFLELGNKYTGDCVFINAGEFEILIDAGSRADSVDDIYEYVKPYVDGQLEYVVVTHAHQDHYAGFATKNYENSLFSKFDGGIGTVVTFAQTNQKADKAGLYQYFENNVKTLKEKGTERKFVNEYFERGASATVKINDNVSIEFLEHKFYHEKSKTENNYSVCFQILETAGENVYRYLFTGDLEEDGEKDLVTKNLAKMGKTRLYKAGHHGSKTSTSQELLDVIDPDAICVCACAGSPEYTKNKDNQFPTQAFVDRVYTKNAGTQVFVTSLCVDYDANKFTSMNGNIVICSAGNSVTRYFSNNPTELRETEWFKTNRKLPYTA
ncbi:metallo-beta-lactamase domain protein [Acidiphilium sp. CAG:727]|nr:metallo-beta-lactamase domain protein [Acidiphilium sp. CAG:727]